MARFAATKREGSCYSEAGDIEDRSRTSWEPRTVRLPREGDVRRDSAHSASRSRELQRVFQVGGRPESCLRPCHQSDEHAGPTAEPNTWPYIVKDPTDPTRKCVGPKTLPPYTVHPGVAFRAAHCQVSRGLQGWQYSRERGCTHPGCIRHDGTTLSAQSRHS